MTPTKTKTFPATPDQLLWWQKPLVIMAHGSTDKPQTRSAIERLVRWKRRAGFNAEFTFLNFSQIQGAGGEDSRAYLFKKFHGYLEDWLDKYLPVAHEFGLRVIPYFNCHWFKTGAFPMDYFVVDQAGKPKVIYGEGYEVCCRGPFRDWSERMAEDLGRYPIDGVFLDGPVKDACWCSHCRAAFRSRHGQDLPENPAACSGSLQAKYAAFLAEMPLLYLEAFGRGLRKHNPQAVLCCNGGDSHQMKASQPWTQLVGEEGGFIGYGPLNGEFPFGAGASAKKIEYRARGRARIVFCDAGYKVYDWYHHPKGEVARMFAGTIANGANVWCGLNRSHLRGPAMQTTLRYNRLTHDYRDALTNSQSLAETAILESPLNQHLAGRIQPTSGDDVHQRAATSQRLAVPRHNQEFRGLYAALTRSGYPFDVLDEDLLLEGALPRRIRLLILPGVSAMTAAVADWVRRFVAAGGRLLATFDTSLFDEHGKRRKDFALADVLGAGVQGDLAGPSGMDYLGIKSRSGLTQDIASTLLPCPEYWRLVKPARAARPLLHYHEKMSRRYATLPPLSPHPAALLHRFGKGQVLFIPSAMGDLSLRFHFPDLRLLLRNAATMLATPPITVEGGDEFVETTLRRSAQGDTVVHLINWAMGERPSSRAIPLGPLRVTVRLPRDAARPRSVQLAMTGRKVKASVKGNAASFVIPRLEEYEMAIL